MARPDPEPQDAALHGPTFAVIAPLVGVLLFLLVLAWRECAPPPPAEPPPGQHREQAGSLLPPVESAAQKRA